MLLHQLQWLLVLFAAAHGLQIFQPLIKILLLSQIEVVLAAASIAADANVAGQQSKACSSCNTALSSRTSTCNVEHMKIDVDCASLNMTIQANVLLSAMLST